ncbi:hypothetical protein QTN47_13405 [Danxiaibacter flavus]|uniref:Uncharacterized protein n=1 Tax=Danxiaibacter flavus TaxID=3049108 RepID=A0ABV3ZJ88_9BACT|nr:hypothetical protein QNM32_13410 [Chitinophagaceae bacterium DXS]
MYTEKHSAVHSFHIPVLGLGFSIDTPLKVARYGISSVVSIVEDELIEDMRVLHSKQNNLSWVAITEKEPDFRAKRITAYLNLLHYLVAQQVAGLKGMHFSPGSDLYKYFELLPETSGAKMLFRQMCAMEEGNEKIQIQNSLRELVHAGSIDVNIMAKVDNNRYKASGEKMPDEYSDALSALRGFAQSKLSASVVFSAGYNPRLYNYVEHFDDFYPDGQGDLKKKIILKVSDYRSALVQGKIFAKKGLWVSEFRIESGLNCGGHAFPTEGLLLGPILEEFKTNRAVLAAELLALCNNALQSKGKTVFSSLPSQKISVQGGVGTTEEQGFLLEYFQLDSVGWGSPFLLVPEATNVDKGTLQQMATAKLDDYFLSNASPLGVPFNNFRISSSETQRKTRIENNRAGSPCYLKYLCSDTEFTEIPICTASRQYQHLKEKQLREAGLSESVLQARLDRMKERDCLCEGLTASARLKNEVSLPHKLTAVAICPGPNLAYFSGIFSLKEMVGHIYGRINILNSLYRPHMFINELKMYIDYIKRKIADDADLLNESSARYYRKFIANLNKGIAYYKSIIQHIQHTNVAEDLRQLELQLAALG